MSIENTKVIDLVNESQEEIVLIISDHLDWESSNLEEHLSLLQNKINLYLHYIKSKQIDKEYKITGKKVIIELISKTNFTEKAIEYLDFAEEVIKKEGLKFKYRTL